MKLFFALLPFLSWLLLGSHSSDVAVNADGKSLDGSTLLPVVPRTGADLNEASIKSFLYGPVAEDATGISYNAKNPPPCGSNCVMAYPRGHANRKAPYNDTEYFYSLVSKLSINGTLLIYPGYYEVNELEIKEGMEIIGLYDQSATIKTVILSGFMPLRAWKRVGTGSLWTHDYPYSIVNYDGDSQGTYTCKDPTSNVCKYAQDLVINGIVQNQWECSTVVGCVLPTNINGQWYLDRTSQPDVNPNDNFILLRSVSNPNAADTRISHFRGAFKEGTKNVKVRNINFKGYTLHSFATDDNWIVTNCLFEKNGVTGLNLSGNNVAVSRNHFRENGCTGLQGALTRSAIKFNKIENNNVGGHKPGRHAGGLKLVMSHTTNVERNYVLDNEGAGLWADVYCNGVEMHHNLIVETKNSKGLQARGIQYEMSSGNRASGKWDIHNNIIKVEGGIAGIISIYALNSQYLEIYNNTVRNAQNGILVAQDSRGYVGNCANGYPGCVSCSETNMDPGCDNNCVTGINSDNSSGSRCMQQVRDIKVFYNDISVGGKGYLLAGLIVEPGLGQTVSEPGGISPSRFFDKSQYKIDFDYNLYTIPENPLYVYPFQWGWDAVTQKTKRMNWDEANDFIDFNSCLNGMCGETSVSRAMSDIIVSPNPFDPFLTVSSEMHNTTDLQLRLVNEHGLRYSLIALNSTATATRFDTSGVPDGKYILEIINNGKVIQSIHVVKK